MTYSDLNEQNNGFFAQLSKMTSRIRKIESQLIPKTNMIKAPVTTTDNTMVPIKPLIKGFLPWMNQIAAMLGKLLAIEIDAPEMFYIQTEQRLAYQQVLYHLLQNAVTHGIETPEKRLAKGKSRQGYISVTFDVTDDGHCLTIQDDGMGFKTAKMEATKTSPKSGQSSGQLNESPDAGSIMTDEHDKTPDFLTFTGDEASLGIGMHLVKKHLSKLSGELQISSELGKQTTIKVLFQN